MKTINSHIDIDYVYEKIMVPVINSPAKKIRFSTYFKSLNLYSGDTEISESASSKIEFDFTPDTQKFITHWRYAIEAKFLLNHLNEIPLTAFTVNIGQAMIIRPTFIQPSLLGYAFANVMLEPLLKTELIKISKTNLLENFIAHIETTGINFLKKGDLSTGKGFLEDTNY